MGFAGRRLLGSSEAGQSVGADGAGSLGSTALVQTALLALPSSDPAALDSRPATHGRSMSAVQESVLQSRSSSIAVETLPVRESHWSSTRPSWARKGFTRLGMRARDEVRRVKSALGFTHRGGGPSRVVHGAGTDFNDTLDSTGGTLGGTGFGFRGQSGAGGRLEGIFQSKSQPMPFINDGLEHIPPKEQHGLWATRLATLCVSC